MKIECLIFGRNQNFDLSQELGLWLLTQQESCNFTLEHIASNAVYGSAVSIRTLRPGFGVIACILPDAPSRPGTIR
jgi:hypothetical protein